MKTISANHAVLGETFGFVGLGKMGKPMARNLAAVVKELRVFDIAGTETRAPENTRPCSSFNELARECGTIFLSLPDGEAVTQLARMLVDQKDAVCRTVIDTSTVGVKTAQDLERMQLESGIAHLDCPVSGGQSGARAGTLTFMCSGSEAHFRKLEAIFTRIFPFLQGRERETP